MGNKITKKYKRNNKRKIRGGGYIEKITGFFQTTSDTNKEMSQIKELKINLATNMQELTNTYNLVLNKVNNLNAKIDNLSNINDTYQQNEIQKNGNIVDNTDNNSANNGFLDKLGTIFGNKNNNKTISDNNTYKSQSKPEEEEEEEDSEEDEITKTKSYGGNRKSRRTRNRKSRRTRKR